MGKKDPYSFGCTEEDLPMETESSRMDTTEKILLKEKMSFLSRSITD